MKVVLRRRIEVRCLAVFAEIAVLEERPELTLLCSAARPTGRLDETVVQRVVPCVGESGARNLLAWCRDLGVCEPSGALTPLGEEVASHGLAPVPEQGVYEVVLIDDPLLGSRVLAFERLGPRVEQRFDLVSSFDGTRYLNRLSTSAIDRSTRFVIRAFPSAAGDGVCALRNTAQCDLVWVLDFDEHTNAFHLEGSLTLDGRRQTISSAPEAHAVDLETLLHEWAAVHFKSHGRWSREARLLQVSFDALSAVERTSFRKQVTVPRVEVAGAGSFESVTFEDLPIGPLDAAGAQAWADSLLRDELVTSPTFRTRSDLQSLLAKRVRATPLARFEPVVPSHAALLSAAPGPAVFWSLAAPVDLSPTCPSPQDLGELRLEPNGGAA